MKREDKRRLTHIRKVDIDGKLGTPNLLGYGPFDRMICCPPQWKDSLLTRAQEFWLIVDKFHRYADILDAKPPYKVPPDRRLVDGCLYLYLIHLCEPQNLSDDDLMLLRDLFLKSFGEWSSDSIRSSIQESESKGYGPPWLLMHLIESGEADMAEELYDDIMRLGTLWLSTAGALNAVDQQSLARLGQLIKTSMQSVVGPAHEGDTRPMSKHPELAKNGPGHLYRSPPARRGLKNAVESSQNSAALLIVWTRTTPCHRDTAYRIDIDFILNQFTCWLWADR